MSCWVLSKGSGINAVGREEEKTAQANKTAYTIKSLRSSMAASADKLMLMYANRPTISVIRTILEVR